MSFLRRIFGGDDGDERADERERGARAAVITYDGGNDEGGLSRELEAEEAPA
jgi:hypothetical protein